VDELPPRGFAAGAAGYQAPVPGSPDPEIDPASERIQRLHPFPAWDGKDFLNLPLLIKTAGKCTTDHISMAGPWLRYRGHLQNISQNLLLGATDAFTGMSGAPVAQRAAELKQAEGGSVIVAGDNYGEGSSREHAAMEPRYLGVKAIMAKSFARIHETNLKKQGVLALTFADPSDYDKVRPGDRISILCSSITPGAPVEIVLHHSDGPAESIEARHSYNDQQIGWLRAGSALNALSAGK
jgi:aconitate hydratase